MSEPIQRRAAPSVLVAVDSTVLREAVRLLLADAGYRATTVADGAEAIDALADRPDVLVLDVAISGRFAFEVIDQVRATEIPARSLLLTSVHSPTGYMRRPTSLYGADDYIEQHQLAESLVAKVAKLVGAAAPNATASAATSSSASAGRLAIRSASPAEREARAERLARLIIADVAQENRAALARGDHDDPQLHRDLDEGRLLFELRIAEETRRGRDFIGEALSEWQRKERA